MKRTLLLLLFNVCFLYASADHITGGEMYYTFLGNSNGRSEYSVTMKLFMRCNSGRQFPDPAIISVFDKLTFTRVQDINVAIARRETIAITQHDPCISNPPVVCYEVAYYQFLVSVPVSQSGYTVASMVNYRIRGISNLDGSQVGATYTCEIPGTDDAPTGPTNNSAVFTGSDLVVVCAGNYFSYSFAAHDPDGDQIRYSFCSAYQSSSGGNGIPTPPPPYSPVPYNGEYSETAPLGMQVAVNQSTGLITGVAPPGGVYVVTVCAEEIRGGQVIAIQRKDIQINVADCSVAAAQLEPDYMLCGASRSINIRNISTSPLIVSHDWDVYYLGGSSLFSSTASVFSYTFPGNGTFVVRLIVNRGQQCSDTTTAVVYVYPGLAPDFDATGMCVNKPTVFTDRTTIQSGAVNSWRWDFGEPSTLADVANTQHSTYTYPVTGVKEVRLMVTTTDGCRDTVYKPITIFDKPPVMLSFKDTLICVNDAVQLQASGTGNFTWSPSVNMINGSTASPTVSPATTTWYYVDLDVDGCKNRDSVLVRVVDHVTLQMMSDTSICRGDTIQLHIVSDALQYNWISATGEIMNPFVKNPLVITTPVRSAYQVTAVIGGCSTSGSVNVNTIPYPSANAGTDTTICYNTPALLYGASDGSSWQWSPAPTLSNASSLNPIARPTALITPYVLTVFDNRGCPKPGRDTVVVTMLPKIKPFAGRDTVVVMNQPLQLNASGGVKYVWSPSQNLSDPLIGNPVALFKEPSEGIRYKVFVYNEAGCFDTASFKITVFATGPTVFVPTGFTPNNDGRNDILIPVAVGMKYIQQFSIYNRWGQLVFSTNASGQGWDGRIGGQFQGPNSYVWMVKAVDYNGKAYFLKGMVTLIK
jgi:gliding motility-associated-like protein